MTKQTYRIESNHPMMGPLMPPLGSKFIHIANREFAILLASKSITQPLGHEIRMVHVPTGAIVFRKSEPAFSTIGDDF